MNLLDIDSRLLPLVDVLKYSPHPQQLDPEVIEILKGNKTSTKLYFWMGVYHHYIACNPFRAFKYYVVSCSSAIDHHAIMMLVILYLSNKCIVEQLPHLYELEMLPTDTINFSKLQTMIKYKNDPFTTPEVEELFQLTRCRYDIGDIWVSPNSTPVEGIFDYMFVNATATTTPGMSEMQIRLFVTILAEKYKIPLVTYTLEELKEKLAKHRKNTFIVPNHILACFSLMQSSAACMFIVPSTEPEYKKFITEFVDAYNYLRNQPESTDFVAMIYCGCLLAHGFLAANLWMPKIYVKLDIAEAAEKYYGLIKTHNMIELYEPYFAHNSIGDEIFDLPPESYERIVSYAIISNHHNGINTGRFMTNLLDSANIKDGYSITRPLTFHGITLSADQTETAEYFLVQALNASRQSINKAVVYAIKFYEQRDYNKYIDYLIIGSNLGIDSASLTLAAIVKNMSVRELVLLRAYGEFGVAATFYVEFDIEKSKYYARQAVRANNRYLISQLDKLYGKEFAIQVLLEYADISVAAYHELANLHKDNQEKWLEYHVKSRDPASFKELIDYYYDKDIKKSRLYFIRYVMNRPDGDEDFERIASKFTTLEVMHTSIDGEYGIKFSKEDMKDYIIYKFRRHNAIISDCCVCYDESVECLLLDCNINSHSLCDDCYLKLYDKPCPICRQ